MKKLARNLTILFVSIISLSFFALIGFQKYTMERGNFMPQDEMMMFENDFNMQQRPPQPPPIAIPQIIILLISVLFCALIIKYLNKNFIEPLEDISEGLKKIKEGNLNISFKTKSENETIQNTYTVLNDMVLGLITKEKLRNNFIQNITHDLKAPLMAQERAIAILHDEFKDHELIQGLSENNETYLKMINLILDVYSIENNNIKIEKIDIKLKELVDSVISTLKPSADDKKILLSKQIEDNFTVYADYISLTRILTNLVSNSIENIQEEKNIVIKSKKQKNKTVIIIEDNGCGIATELQKTLFDKYASSHKGGKVTRGLGLAIVKDLVEKNGGMISVESEVNHYTKFIVELPNKELSNG